MTQFSLVPLFPGSDITIPGFRSDPEADALEALSAVVSELEALPPLREYYIAPYLNGGWHQYSKRPPEVEGFKEADGRDPNGKMIYRNRLRNLEKQHNAYVPVNESSREATLSIIREMRHSGWTRKDAERMMLKTAAIGTRWIRAQKDFGAEFERCWTKALVPVSDLAPRPVSALRGEGEFVSHPRYREAVRALIENHPEHASEFGRQVGQ